MKGRRASGDFSQGREMTLLCPVLSVLAVVVCAESTEAGASPPMRVVPSLPEERLFYRIDPLPV